MSTEGISPLHALSRDPSGASIGLTERALPPGHVVEVPGAGPLYWMSEGAPRAADVAAARVRFGISGLWPLLVDGDGCGTLHEAAGERVFHWLGEGRPSSHLDIDPEKLLAEGWAELVAEEEQDDDYEPEERVSALAPRGASWPGLAPAAAAILAPDGHADVMTAVMLDEGWLEQPRMVLIPAASGSDALIAARCILAEIEDLAGHAAVLRSWERRFGARVVALRHDTLFLSVAAAPTNLASAAHIGCEHFVFAPDNVTQNSDSFAEYVEGLIGSNSWSFWWD